MKTIYLISCVKTKGTKKAKARELFQSDCFKKALLYSEKQSPDAIYLLSGKYGLISPDEVIEPYDHSQTKTSALENKKWAEKIIAKLEKVSDLKNDKFIILAGKKYRKNILPNLCKCEIPMEGLRQGEQLHWLGERV